MIPVYTIEALNTRTIAELKSIAATLGIAPEGNKTKRTTWIDAIIAHQATIQSVADIAPVAVELPQDTLDLLAEIDARFDQAFEVIANLKSQYSQAIAKIDSIIAAKPVSNIWWYSINHQHGTVTIDQECRQFRVVSLYGDRPEVEVQAADGTWVNSRWQSAKNNRYINAVIEGIPARRDEMYQRVIDTPMSEFDLAEECDQPPGRGDGRGRIDAEIESDWIEF